MTKIYVLNGKRYSINSLTMAVKLLSQRNSFPVSPHVSPSTRRWSIPVTLWIDS